jgi:NADH:ubiquinone oxidoreductase subunit 3 (subunit A)
MNSLENNRNWRAVDVENYDSGFSSSSALAWNLEHDVVYVNYYLLYIGYIIFITFNLIYLFQCQTLHWLTKILNL